MGFVRLCVLGALSVALLAACGRVVVFGHVVREGTAPEVPQSEAPSGSEGAAKQPAGAAQPSDSPINAAPAGNTPVTSSQRNATASSSQASVPILKAITLRVTPQATDSVASDTPFAPELLLEAIRTELRSRKLLDEHNPQITGTAEVQIDQVAVRPSTNAIVFGYKMMASTLIGDIHVIPADGSVPPDLHVTAESRLTLSAEGENKNPLGPLYRRFAELTADRLAGVESKSNDTRNGGPQRF